jgi:hypothetical protein
MLRTIRFAAAVGIGTLGQIVAVVVALRRESIRGDDLRQRFCRRQVNGSKRCFSFSDQCLNHAGPHQGAAL